MAIKIRRTVVEFQLGDHLVTQRFGYTHHGIYAGEERVIHYAGFSKAFKKDRVEITSLEEFSRGRKIRVQPHKDARYSPQDIVERARSRVGEDSYNFVFNNCEHFVYWCITGKEKSRQVRSAATNGIVVGGILALRMAIKIRRRDSSVLVTKKTG